MLNLLRRSSTYYRIVLASLPVLAVANDGFSALLLGITLLVCSVVSACAINLISPLLTEKTASFARLVISVGVSGIFAALMSILFYQLVSSLTAYIALCAVLACFTTQADQHLKTKFLSSLSGTAIVGAACAVFVIAGGIIREFLGSASVFGVDIYSKIFTPAAFFTTPAGGLLVAAVFALIYKLLCGASFGKEAE